MFLELYRVDTIPFAYCGGTNRLFKASLEWRVDFEFVLDDCYVSLHMEVMLMMWYGFGGIRASGIISRS